MSKVDWTRHEKQFRRSGLSLREYCEQRGLSLSTARKHIKVGQELAKKNLAKASSLKGSWKYHWDGLKREWLSEDYPSLADFARSRGMNPDDANFKKQTHGWNQEKKRLKDKSYQEAKQEVAQAMKKDCRDYFQEIRDQVENTLKFLADSDENLQTLLVDDQKDFRDINASAKTRLETAKLAKELLAELQPIPTSSKEDFKIDEALKDLFIHVAGTGDLTATLNVLKTIAQVKVMGTGFNWQAFAALAQQGIEDASSD